MLADSVPSPRPTAAVTGASSGIGAATVRALAAAGYRVIAGARRTDRLAVLARDLGERVQVQSLDVTDEESTRAFADGASPCSVLVCNAGGALGADSVVDADDDQWRWMWETNVLGTVRTIRAMVPALRASGGATVVVVTSLAAHQTYAGGAGYASAKHAAAAVTDTLRLELLGEPVRVTELAPGMVQTEFSTHRFGGDHERAAVTYRGMRPLTADDVAEAVAWVVSRPGHVSIPRLHIYPADQAGATDVHRRDSP